MRKRIIGCIALLALVTGCTTTLDAELPSGSGENDVYGIPYTLTFTTFDITLKRQLVECEGEAEIRVTADAVARQAPDPKRHYRINLDDLDSFFRKTKLSVTYHDDGSLAAVNGKVEDRTGEFLGKVLTGTASVLIQGVAAKAAFDDEKSRKPAGVPVPEEARYACTDEIKAAIASLDPLKSEVEMLQDELTALTDQLDNLVSHAKALGKNVPADMARSVASKLAEVQQKELALKAKQKALSGVVGQLTVVDKLSWPRNGEEFWSGDVGSELSVTSKLGWFEKKQQGGLFTEQELNRKLKDSNVDLFLVSTDPRSRAMEDLRKASKKSAPAQLEVVSETKKGLKYRIPVAGRLCAIRNARSATGEVCGAYGKVVLDEAVMVSQVGPIHVLPLKTRIFGNKSIKAEFDKNGLPQLLEANSEAGADKMGALLDTSVAQYVALEKARLEAKKAEQEAAKTKDLDALRSEIEMAKAEIEYRKLMEELEPPVLSDVDQVIEENAAATALLNSEATLLETQLRLIQAEQKIAEAASLVP